MIGCPAKVGTLKLKTRGQQMGWVKVHYLDASALVKLVIGEPGSEPLRKFFYQNANFCTTTFCLAEALSVLKGKWRRKEISWDQIS